MKIIKKGKRPIIKYRGTCSTCGCIIECNYTELRIEEDRNIEQCVYTCPTCSLNIYCAEYSR